MAKRKQEMFLFSHESERNNLHFPLMWILLPPLQYQEIDHISNLTYCWINLHNDDRLLMLRNKPHMFYWALTTSSTRSSTMRPCSSVRTLVTHIQPSSSSLWTINMSPFRKLEMSQCQYIRYQAQLQIEWREHIKVVWTSWQFLNHNCAPPSQYLLQNIEKKKK